jgi:hypothetical protein
MLACSRRVDVEHFVRVSGKALFAIRKIVILRLRNENKRLTIICTCSYLANTMLNAITSDILMSISLSKSIQLKSNASKLLNNIIYITSTRQSVLRIHNGLNVLPDTPRRLDT